MIAVAGGCDYLHDCYCGGACCRPILSLFLSPGFFSFSVVGARLFAYCCCGGVRAPFRTTELHFPAVPLFSVACSPSTMCCGKLPSLRFVSTQPNWKASCKKLTRGLTATGKVMTPFGQSSPSLCTLQHTATHCNTLQHTATGKVLTPFVHSSPSLLPARQAPSPHKRLLKKVLLCCTSHYTAHGNFHTQTHHTHTHTRQTPSSRLKRVPLCCVSHNTVHSNLYTHPHTHIRPSSSSRLSRVHFCCTSLHKVRSDFHTHTHHTLLQTPAQPQKGRRLKSRRVCFPQGA